MFLVATIAFALALAPTGVAREKREVMEPLVVEAIDSVGGGGVDTLKAALLTGYLNDTAACVMEWRDPDIPDPTVTDYLQTVKCVAKKRKDRLISYFYAVVASLKKEVRAFFAAANDKTEADGRFAKKKVKPGRISRDRRDSRDSGDVSRITDEYGE